MTANNNAEAQPLGYWPGINTRDICPPNPQISALRTPRSVCLSAGGAIDFFAAAIDYRVNRVLSAGPAANVVSARGRYGVLVAGVGILPTGIHTGTYVFQGKGRLHPVSIVHGPTDCPTDSGARESAHDDGCSPAATAPDLIAQQAAECAADNHAGLFVESICGAAIQDQGGRQGSRDPCIFLHDCLRIWQRELLLRKQRIWGVDSSIHVFLVLSRRSEDSGNELWRPAVHGRVQPYPVR